MQRLARRAVCAALMALVPGSALAAPQVSLTLGAPDPMEPQPTGSFEELRIDYLFTQDPLVNPRITVDLPPNILFWDASDNDPFTTSCTYQQQQDPPVPIDQYSDWICTLSADLIDPGAGLSSRAVLRIVPMQGQFIDGEQVTLTATLTADNLPSPVSADVTVSVTTHVEMQDWFREIVDLATVKSPTLTDAQGNPLLGIATGLFRSPVNAGNGYVGHGVQARVDFLPGAPATWVLKPLQGHIWEPLETMWTQVTQASVRLPTTFGPVYAGLQSSPYGSKAGNLAPSAGGQRAGPVVWRQCGSPKILPAQVAASLWGPVSRTDPTLAQLAPVDGGTFNYSTFEGNWFDCSTGVTLGIAGSNPVVGSTMQFGAVPYVPMGAVPLHKLFVSLTIDPNVDWESGGGQTSSNLLNNLAPPLDYWLCTFPDEDVDVEEFLAARDTALCDYAGYQYTDQSVPFAGHTHFVGYADTYSYDQEWGETVPRHLAVSMYGQLDCSLGGATLTTTSRFSAQRTVDGPVIDSGLVMTERVVDDQAPFYHNGPSFFAAGDYSQYIDSVGRGKGFVVHTDLSANQLGVNPHARYTLPPGIRFVDAVFEDFIEPGQPTSCQKPYVKAVTSPGPDGSTYVDVTLRADANDATWYYMSNCEETNCAPAGRGALRLSLYVDPTFPWHDGDPAPITEWWDADNNNFDTYDYTNTLSINVPTIQRLTIEPVCEGTGGGGDCSGLGEPGRRPGLLATAQNLGGIDLPNVIATVEIPKAGVAGSEVDTFLDGIDAPPGLTIECTSDGSSWSPPPCPPQTVRVRGKLAALEPLEEVAFTVWLDIPGGTTGQRAYGRGSLASDELLEVPTASVAPIRVNLCPGKLVSNVFFDADSDGTQDPGEQNLPDWSLSLSDTSGTQTFDYGLGGTLSMNLAEGNYGWDVARAGEATEGVFYVVPAPAGPASYSITVCSDETTPLSIPVNCDCDDGSDCTEDTCTFLGECVHTVTTSGGGLDDDCDGVDDDCDGAYDEDFVEMEVPCDNEGCAGVGVRYCYYSAGVPYEEYCYASGPSPEECNGTDDDCDDLVDGDDLELVPGPCQLTNGVCAGAQHARSDCVDGQWQPCPDLTYVINAFVNHRLPFTTTPASWVSQQAQADGCDGLDNDCDGFVDENFSGASRSCGSGPCTAWASDVCTWYGAVMPGNCEPNWGMATTEVCDYQDNNCDGLIDAADPTMERPVCDSDAVGVCAGALKPPSLCVYGSWQACGPADYAYAAFPDYALVDDSCDGVDNDCDGVADDDFVTQQVTCEGSCSELGTRTCRDGAEVDTCVGGESAPEICDGLDNDCDGLVDQSDPDFEREACGDQDGVCLGAEKPLHLCRGTSGWDECAPADYAAYAFPAYALTDSVCDNLDNDCDGDVDEDYVGQLALCPAGACHPTARERCVNGSIVTGCQPFGPGCEGSQVDCEACQPDVEVVLYGVAENAAGSATGSFRCTYNDAGITCETDVDGNLEVSNTLWCAQ